jgi:hypothetical protein
LDNSSWGGPNPYPMRKPAPYPKGYLPIQVF